MKKTILTLLVSLGFMPLLAVGSDFGDIDAILNANALRDAANRYNSVMLFFFPDQTTRLGFTSGNSKLSARTKQNEKQALLALQTVHDGLESIDKKALTDESKVDYHLLDSMLDWQKWRIKQRRLETDPLYYAQALDSLFDLSLRSDDNLRQFHANTLLRAKALPTLASQAKENLVDVAPFLAQLAMEKAYYAQLAFDEITDRMLASAVDEFTANDLKQQLTLSKRAISDMFDLFKSFALLETTTDFRMGEKTFKDVLEKKYHIKSPISSLIHQADQNLDAAQHELYNALLPFENQLPKETQMMVVEDENGEMVEVPVEQPRKQGAFYEPPSASDFYYLAANFPAPNEDDDIVELVSAEVAALGDYLFQGTILKPLKNPVPIKPLPTYYAYMYPHVFVPADGLSTFFLRIPSGNSLAKKELLQNELNDPMRRVMIAKEILPGRYYQYAQMANLPNERRLYASPTLRNGWSAFSRQLGADNGFFTTPEELLAFAWDKYLDAIKAVLDVYLQSGSYDYSSAWNFLVNQQGFPQDKAEDIIRQVVENPGEGISTLVGEETIARVYNKYVHKINYKFTHADLIELFMKAGNVEPEDLDKEIKRLYKERKK